MIDASVLVYGSDPQLLATRSWVLERAGARVRTATELTDFGQLEADEPVDLIIFCHSLSTEQCDLALDLAHTLWPEIEILSLITGMSGCHPGFSDTFADASKGPAHLVQIVAKLIEAHRTNKLLR